MTKENSTTTTKQKNKPMPMPMEFIKANLVICPESRSGLRWITQRGSNKPGPAGNLDKGRYTIWIQGRAYRAHRVVYALHTGNDPGVLLVDHMDGNPSNNHPNNLRKATHSQNQMNRATMSNNTSGVPGVYWDAWRGKWKARVQKARVQKDGCISSKYFEDLNDAAAWVSEKRREVFGEFAPENRKGIIEVAREPVPEPGPDAYHEALNEPVQLQLFG